MSDEKIRLVPMEEKSANVYLETVTSAAISLKRIADALEKSAEEKERANKLAKIQLNEIYGKVGKRRLVRLSDWFNAKFALFD